ncbi:Hsp70 family protein [Candidatus Binatia bacterium]|nr:Hsp70 family protein [Candidatus Binatia bacterium]
MLGLDFGTTNSAVGVARRDGNSRLAEFGEPGRRSLTFRSVLHFSGLDRKPKRRPEPTAGPWAIDSYRDEGAGGRFLQSLKSHLASRTLSETYVFGWKFTLEDLVALILGELRRIARDELGDPGERVLLGRPVHFAAGPEGHVDEDGDARALARLEAAARQAGFTDVAFEFEPVAAAHEYERSLDHDELVLIGDFGGGTSDFCLVRLGPSTREQADRSQSILGIDGVPIAGGAFDGRIVRAVVAPRLGLGSLRRSEHGKTLPMPAWIFSRLERWEDVSFLAQPSTFETLKQLRFQAVEPSKIDSLIRLVEDDLGYLLYEAVERTKLDLSSRDSAMFEFRELPRRITQEVEQYEFEGWLEPDLTRLASCVDRLLARCGVAPADVDRVFLTGGSSLVPCVRRLFVQRFGDDRLRGGEELTTVARGLALIAASR